MDGFLNDGAEIYGAAYFGAIIVDFVEHANARLPVSLDRVLRVVFVTPDMHRIHHSQVRGEGNSNFSNMLSVWDRLFGTYVHQPAAGHDGIAFGVPEFTDRKHLTLPWMLVQPLLGLSSRRREPIDAQPRTTDRPGAPASRRQ